MFKNLLGAAILSTGLMACQPAKSAPDLKVENASVRAPLPGQSTAVAYFDIVNAGTEDVLLSARSNVSERVELHDHLHEGGVMKMRKVETVALAQNETTSFKSGGLHIMLFDALIEGPVTLTLDFKTHDDIVVEIVAPSN